MVEILTRDREGWWKEVSILAWLRRKILSGVFILNLYTYESFNEILTSSYDPVKNWDPYWEDTYHF